MTFATVEDLLAGWPNKTFSASERASAEVLLERASAHLSRTMRRRRVPVDPEDEEQAVNLCSVVCNMVRRVMEPRGDGLASLAQSIGSTNVSVSYRESYGAFRILPSEEDLLGISGRGSFRMLRAAIRNGDGSPAEGW